MHNFKTIRKYELKYVKDFNEDIEHWELNKNFTESANIKSCVHI